jgi:hypothetical protein
MPPIRRVRALRFAVVMFALLTAVAGMLFAVASPATALAPVSAAHPYSDPLYWPLRDPSYLNCVLDNPGCTPPHTFWGIILTPAGQTASQPLSKISKIGVYSMGAGILRIGNAHGTSCNHGTNWGTWVLVDHGGGVVSKYLHLSQILGHDGQYVAPGQRIGTVGTTGKNGLCNVSYTDIVVNHGWAWGPTVPDPSLIACVGSVRQAWPHALYGGRYSSWNSVPLDSKIPGSGSGCLPTSVPKTAPRPSVVASRPGSGRITLRWTAPAAASHVTSAQVEVRRYFPSLGIWDPWHPKYIWVKPSSGSYTFTGLYSGTLYRVVLHLRNAAGWSAMGLKQLTAS